MTDEEKRGYLGHYSVGNTPEADGGEYVECWCGAKTDAEHKDPGPQAGEHPGDKGVGGKGDAKSSPKDAAN